MGILKIKRSWSEQQDKLQQKFTAFAESDLMLEKAKKYKLFGMLQSRLDKAKEEIQKIIK